MNATRKKTRESTLRVVHSLLKIKAHIKMLIIKLIISFNLPLRYAQRAQETERETLADQMCVCVSIDMSSTLKHIFNFIRKLCFYYRTAKDRGLRSECVAKPHTYQN